MLKRLSLLAVASVLVAGAPAQAQAQAQPAAALKTVKVLATGGTIAGAGQGSSANYKAGVVPIGDILRTVPGINDIARIDAEQVANVGSFNVDEALWLKLLGRVRAATADPAVAGVVVTHGTDTLEETAFFLRLVTPSTKPVVVVGSMRPGTAVSADGPQNLLDAVRVASAPEARDQGALVVMNDTIFDPFSVTKSDVRRVNAFAAPGRGPIGEVLADKPRFFTAATPFQAAFPIVGETLPRVAIAYAYAGVRGEDIRAAAAGAKGLVIAGVGGGAMSSSAWSAVNALISQGVPVVRTARHGSGDVWELPPEKDDQGDQAIAGRELNPAKARILLMLALQSPRSRAELQALFDRYGISAR